jgi:integrase
LFRYALVKTEGLEQNPASDLDVVALPALMTALRNYGGANQTRLGLRLLLTGVRTGELRLATHDPLDLQQRLWIMPAQVVKHSN